MKKYCVPFHIAELLKEKGFKEHCIFAYDRVEMFCSYLSLDKIHTGKNYNSSGYCCSAPFWEQVFQWLELEKKIFISVAYLAPDTNMFKYRIDDYGINVFGKVSGVFYSDRNQCMEAAVIFALK